VRHRFTFRAGAPRAEEEISTVGEKVFAHKNNVVEADDGPARQVWARKHAVNGETVTRAY